MKVNKIKDGIYEISDFVTVSEQQQILSELNSMPEEDWWEDDPNYYIEFWYGKRKTLNSQVLEPFNERVASLFKSFSDMTSVNHVCRYKKGDALGHHRDDYKDNPGDKISYGIVIYWNDDYDGGELHYPELDFTLKPKARSLILHNSDLLHGTLPVKGNNVRYFSTAFIRESLESPATLSDIFE